MSHTRPADVVVIGGGLAGLTAATYLARAGRKVTLFEKARDLGGRAITVTKSDFHFNLGPHALYRGGAGIQILRELGIAFTGRPPTVSNGYAFDHGQLHTFPGGFVSLLTTGLLRWSEKIEMARLMGTLPKIDATSLHHLTVQAWLERMTRSAKIRQLLSAFIRVSTYANAPERQSAGVALHQTQLALTKSVLYLDGGWQTLTDGLRASAESAGVRIATGQKITTVEHDTIVHGVRIADGSFLPASAVILTGSPEDALALLPGIDTPLHAWAKTALPIKAACLDVGLARLPRPHALFALGVDQPLYFSVHSAAAQLAPRDRAVIQVAKYLDPMQASDLKTDEGELEQLLDLMQPGWREVMVERRFLPRLTVYHALPTASGGGFASRPGAEATGVENLFLAGDWIGSEGLLVDASLASAKRAAQQIIQDETLRTAA